MKRIFKILVICFLLIVFSHEIAGAHTDGASIEVPVNSYLLDIGYSPEITTAGTQTRFDFLILTAETKEEVVFDDIWVRIEKDGRIFFAGGLGKQRFGYTGLTHLFLEPGTYEIFVRFAHEGESLAETTFEFPVVESEVKTEAGTPLTTNLLWMLVGVVLGAALLWFIGRSNQKNNL